MKLVPDEAAAAWLRDFVPDPDDFDWDAGNTTKSSKHEVYCEDVESIIRHEAFIFAGRIVEHGHEEWRGLILGFTDKGRPLALIFTRRGDKLRPISCRAMRQEERRLYASSNQKQS